MGLWADIKGITGLGSSAGFLKRSSVGALSVDTSTYGDVVGPAGATSGHVAVFDGATGKLLADGGAISTDGSTERVLSANLTIAAGRSYVVCGPLETNGFILSIAATGRMRVL